MPMVKSATLLLKRAAEETRTAKIYDIDRSGSTTTLYRVPAYRKIVSFCANLDIIMITILYTCNFYS